VHLVRLALEVAEKAVHAVPIGAVLAFLVGKLEMLRVALDDPLLHPRREIVKRLVHRHAFLRAETQEVALALGRDAALPRLDHAVPDAEAAVGQRAVVIDLDGAAEAAAGRARAARIVEGEERGRGFAELGAVVGADPGAGETELLGGAKN
jgi:hypothetical protein